MKVIAIEGNTQRLDGGAMYGNAPRPVWERWSPPDERNRITLACRAMLVVGDDGKKVLFETGIGAFFEPKMRDRFGVVEAEHVLLKSLEAAGHPHDEIDFVVLSHLHFDHAGGLLSAHGDGEPRLLFPRARYVTSRAHFERARAPHVRDRASFIPMLNDLLEKSGRLELVERTPPRELEGLVTFHLSDGHTPGLLLSEVATPQGPLLFAADLIPGVPWVHVPITMGYDRYPELLIDEKASLLSSLSARGGSLFFTHDPGCASARVLHDDRASRYTAQPLALA